MTTYRKRGTEVEAFRWDGLTGIADNVGGLESPVWFSDLFALDKARTRGEREFAQVFLDPPSGKGNPLVANLGDWIVRNARGEVFPMTAEKFAETYEVSA